jgi:hypothetical protein
VPLTDFGSGHETNVSDFRSTGDADLDTATLFVSGFCSLSAPRAIAGPALGAERSFCFQKAEPAKPTGSACVNNANSGSERDLEIVTHYGLPPRSSGLSGPMSKIPVTSRGTPSVAGK